MTKERDSKEVVNESFNTISKVIIAAGAAASIGDPMIGAGASALITGFYGLRGKLKSNRIHNFIIELGKYMKTIKIDFDWENANVEEFSDFFEQLLAEVSLTPSKEKLERFKLIAAGQITDPKPFDKAHRVMILINHLSDSQINLLRTYVDTEAEFIKIQEKDYKANQLLESLVQEGSLDKDRLSDVKWAKLYNENVSKAKAAVFETSQPYNRIRRKRNEQIIPLGEANFIFMLNELRVLGLIYQPLESKSYDDGEYSGYRCTQLAIDLIEFLRYEHN